MALLAKQRQRIDELEAQNAWLKHQLFGHKSERLRPNDPNQPELFESTTQAAETDAASDGESNPSPDEPLKPRRRGKRSTPSGDLPIIERVYDLPEDQREGMSVMDSQVSYTLAFEPGKLYWIKHIQLKYAPAPANQRAAEGLGEPDGPTIRLAPKPIEGLPKCLADPSLLAHLAVSKYADHLPIHRTESILNRGGMSLAPSSMSRWLIRAAELLLPLVSLLRAHVLNSFCVQADETTVRQQQADQSYTHQSYFWVYLGDAVNPFVVVDYRTSRSRAGPVAFFGDEQGQAIQRDIYLQCDGYSAYDAFVGENSAYGMVRVGCWAHVRRHFKDAVYHAPALAKSALRRIAQLYRIEREAEDLDDAARVAMRREKAEPVINALVEWCGACRNDSGSSVKLRQAIDYLLNRVGPLKRYLDDGRLAIDNNACERAVRPLAIGRKNWLFVGNERAGQAAAVWMSLIGSCRRCGVEPWAYLTHVLRQLPTTPPEHHATLLPNRWQPPNA